MIPNIEDEIISFFEGHLSEARVSRLQTERKNVESVETLFQDYKMIYEDIENQEYIQPSSNSVMAFEAILQKEKLNQAASYNMHKPQRITLFRTISYAASIIMLISVGLVIGFQLSQNNDVEQVNKELLVLKNSMNALLEDESTSMRIKAISMSYNVNKIDQDVVAALVKTMNGDSSENVRLAAIDALGKFADEEIVKKELISALEEQNNSFVQIKIIKILVETNAKDALPSFDQLIEDENTSQFVKNEAIQGKTKISLI